MESEIREQPKVLERNSRIYADALSSSFAGKRYEMVLLAARGSSDHAALYGRYLIEAHLGIPVSLAAPSILTRYGKKIRYPRCLAIGISQSGAAPDVSEVLASIKADGHDTLAITNTPNSRITQAAEHTLLLDVGLEQSIAATKTYTSSLLALYELTRALGAKIPASHPHVPTQEWLDLMFEKALDSLGPVLRSSSIFSIARGYDFCTAFETALKLMECSLLGCKAYSTADFQHGPRALASHGSTAIVFGGEDLNALIAQGCVLIEAPKAKKNELDPLWHVLFGQCLALYAARARGLNPDKSQHLNKVTETL